VFNYLQEFFISTTKLKNMNSSRTNSTLSLFNRKKPGSRIHPGNKEKGVPISPLRTSSDTLVVEFNSLEYIISEMRHRLEEGNLFFRSVAINGSYAANSPEVFQSLNIEISEEGTSLIITLDNSPTIVVEGSQIELSDSEVIIRPPSTGQQLAISISSR